MRVFGASAIGAAAVIALLAGPAHAQTPNINLMPEVKSKTPEEREQDAIKDKAYKEQLKKMRTGRAHTSLIEHIKVDYYGSEMPLNQVANIATEDARTLTVSPWEKAMVPIIEKAIYKSDLGLTPNTAGQIIRIHMPALTEERRRDIIKVVKALIFSPILGFFAAFVVMIVIFWATRRARPAKLGRSAMERQTPHR